MLQKEGYPTWGAGGTGPMDRTGEEVGIGIDGALTGVSRDESRDT